MPKKLNVQDEAKVLRQYEGRKVRLTKQMVRLLTLVLYPTGNDRREDKCLEYLKSI